jgi:hypothetical protein
MPRKSIIEKQYFCRIFPLASLLSLPADCSPPLSANSVCSWPAFSWPFQGFGLSQLCPQRHAAVTEETVILAV